MADSLDTRIAPTIPQSPDPIFGALAELQRAEAAVRKMEYEPPNPAWEAARDAYEAADVALYPTKPTTPEGAATFLRFVAAHLDVEDVVNDNWVGHMIGDAIRAAVAVLEQEARS